jgi:transposase
VKTTITYVAMDVHKKQHEVAVMYGDTGELRRFTVANTPEELARMVKRIRRQGPGEIHICYEAGVCGFVLKRRLEKLGCVCQVNLKRSRQQLNSLLVRHGYVYPGGDLWTGKHQQWLNALVFDVPRLRTVFEEYTSEVQHCVQRLASLDKQLEPLARSEPYRAAVGALRCFRGIDTLTAITVLTEIFEFGRFDSPRALMAYLGVTPSEDSSGDSRRPGGITKTGNRRVRRILTETAWHYRHPHRVGKALAARRKDQPAWAVDLADRAAVRLYRRYRHLIERGKAGQTAIMAVVRELVGFLWAMLRQLHQPTQSPSS